MRHSINGLPQLGTACHMAVTAVDACEVVDIHHDNTQCMPGTPGLSGLDGHPQLTTALVGEPCPVGIGMGTLLLPRTVPAMEKPSSPCMST